MKTVYFDYNASAPAWPEVVETVAETLRRGGNASSVHGPGRAARAAVERARGAVAGLVDVEATQVVFTGSGTEANNQALKCCGRERFFVFAIEHESVLTPRPDATVVPVLADGTADLAALEALLANADAPSMVALMLANNETGVIQPVAEAVRIARQHGALVHCDAVQAAGKIPVDFDALGVDSMALSAHKIGGSQGVGALILRDGSPIGRFVDGGGQERGLRAGTENVAGIAGFGAAADIVSGRLDDFAALAALRDEMVRRIREIAPGSSVFGESAPRLPNTAKLTMPGVDSDTQVMAMDLAGLAISAGSACSAGKVSAPYVLTAMGVPDAEAITAVRVSLGWNTTGADIDRLVAAWEDLYRRAGEKAA